MNNVQKVADRLLATGLLNTLAGAFGGIAAAVYVYR